MSTHACSSRHLLVRLQREWDRLSRSPRAVADAHRWELRIERFASLDDLLRATGYGDVGARHGDDDRVLADLVRLARDHELAARVVLQRLLPGISAIARRAVRDDRSRDEVLDDLVATAWTVIRTYPIERRPTYVAPGLLRSIHYQALQRPTRRLATFVPVAGHAFDATPAADTGPGATEELAELLALARQSGLDERDIELARRLGRGETTTELARSADVTPRTVRNHRAIVAHRLRHVALAGG